MRDKQEGAGHGEEDTEEFHGPRQLARPQGRVADDDDGHEVLQYGAGGGIAVLDGRKIRVLDGQHAEDSKGQDIDGIALLAKQGEDVLTIQGDVDDE